MKDFKEALNSLENRVKKGEVVFKSADKGDVTTAMTPHFYHSLCMRELQKQEFHVNIGEIDPGENILTVVKNFATKYKEELTPNEFNYLTEKSTRWRTFMSFPNSTSQKK